MAKVAGEPEPQIAAAASPTELSFRARWQSLIPSNPEEPGQPGFGASSGPAMAFAQPFSTRSGAVTTKPKANPAMSASSSPPALPAVHFTTSPLAVLMELPAEGTAVPAQKTATPSSTATSRTFYVHKPSHLIESGNRTVASITLSASTAAPQSLFAPVSVLVPQELSPKPHSPQSTGPGNTHESSPTEMLHLPAAAQEVQPAKPATPSRNQSTASPSAKDSLATKAQSVPAAGLPTAASAFEVPHPPASATEPQEATSPDSVRSSHAASNPNPGATAELNAKLRSASAVPQRHPEPVAPQDQPPSGFIRPLSAPAAANQGQQPASAAVYLPQAPQHSASSASGANPISANPSHPVPANSGGAATHPQPQDPQHPASHANPTTATPSRPVSANSGGATTHPQPQIAQRAAPSISSADPAASIPARSPYSASTGKSANPATPSTLDTIAALDAGPASPPTTWLHAGATRAEGGYLDPSLGWVSVRADAAGAALHATIVPASPEAAQVLGTHVAGLNTYLADHHGTAAELTVAAPESNQSFAANSGLDSSGQQPRQDGQPSAATQFDANSPRTADVESAPLVAAIQTHAAPEGYGGHISVIA